MMGPILIFIAWIDLTFCAMAMGFGNDVAHGGSPVTEDQYGAQVYAIPALLWVGAQLIPAALGMIGAIVAAAKGRWTKTGALVSAIGNCGLTFLFALFAVLSVDAEQGALLHYMSKYPGVGITGACAVLCARYFWWGDEA